MSRRGLGKPERLNKLAADSGFAGVVASSAENIIYCTGRYGSGTFTLFSRERSHFVVWPSDGTPTYIVPDPKLPLETTITDVRRYPRHDFDPVDLLADVLREKGLSSAQIGIEMGDLPAATYARLIARLPDADFVEGAGVFRTLRMIKTETEVDILAQAARTAEASIEEVFGRVVSGQTEKAIADDLLAEFSRRGAEIVLPITLAAGPRGWGLDPLPTKAVVQPGELIRVDLMGTFSGYQADVARAAVMRHSSARQRDLYMKIVDIEQQAIDAVAPGIRACDLYEVFRKAFEKADLSMTWGMFGHGIGLSVHEAPVVSPSDATVLKPGTVLSLEPGYVEAGGEGYNVEDLVLVTDHGHDVLTQRRTLGTLRVVG